MGSLFVDLSLYNGLIGSNFSPDVVHPIDNSRFLKCLSVESFSTVDELLEKAHKENRIHIDIERSLDENFEQPESSTLWPMFNEIIGTNLSDIMNLSPNGEICFITEDDAGATIRQLTFEKIDNRWHLGFVFFGNIKYNVHFREMYVRLK